MIKGLALIAILLVIMVTLIIITVAMESQCAGGGQQTVDMIYTMGAQNATH